jgi:hypothetical protein
MRHGLLTFALLALAVCTLAGCPKKPTPTPSEAPLTALPDATGATGASDPAVAAGPPPAPAPLTEAPFNLAGQALGSAPATVRPGLTATGLKYDEHWREENLTGFIRSQPGTAQEDGPIKASAYFEGGELVCYSQVEETDQAVFDKRVAELTAQFGEPAAQQPAFVAESDFMKFFDAEQASVLRCWPDPATQTAYLAGLSKDGTRAVYMIMQPQRFGLSQAETMAAMGS